MKIAIDNLGPIKHADIDLNKDLIILCGGNNSGKTYLAYSVYGLFQFPEMFENIKAVGINTISNELLRYGRIEIDISKFFLAKKEIFIGELEKSLISDLPNIFASEKDFFKNTSINIVLDDNLVTNKLIESLWSDLGGLFGDDLDIMIIFRKESDNSLLNIVVQKKDSKEYLEYLNKNILQEIEKFLMQVIYEFIFNDVHIETAERTAINLFSKEISEKRTKMVDTLLDYDDKKDPLGFIKKQATRYSLPIRESLYLANSMDFLQKKKSPFAYLADEIEKTILQGKIKVADTGELQFSPLKSKKSLGIHLTASGVKSLASIIFYLRHIAKVGDFFIIDEPELNLHPDNQRKVARVIAQMVNAGIKVMLSTHSDYIIRELNNLIMLDVKGNDKVVNKLIKKYGYQKDQILNPEKVGVYLFTDKVEALEVNATGFEVKSIDDEINALNESAQDIFFTLHDN